jgi:5-methylcytosine-specific restriction endonuclease McrA
MEQISKKQFRKLCQYAVHYHFCFCYLCGQPIKDGQHWNLDHVFPKSKGGKTEASNLRPVHYWCNSAKGNMTIEQWREKQR